MVSKKQLFETIDVLVQFEKWNYGEIQDNLITLYTPDKSSNPSHIIHVLFFDDKLLISNRIRDVIKNNHFIKNDGLDEVKKLVFLIKEKQRNKNLISLMAERTTYMQLNNHNENNQITLGHVFSYSFTIGATVFFSIMTMKTIKKSMILESVVIFIVFIIIIYNDLKRFIEDYQAFKRRKARKNGKWYY